MNQISAFSIYFALPNEYVFAVAVINMEVNFLILLHNIYYLEEQKYIYKLWMEISIAHSIFAFNFSFTDSHQYSTLTKFFFGYWVADPLFFWADNGILDFTWGIFTVCKCIGNTEWGSVPCPKGMDIGRGGRTQEKFAQRAGDRAHTCLSILEISPYSLEYYHYYSEALHRIRWRV